jgi:fused signal recognition particle receptor
MFQGFFDKLKNGLTKTKDNLTGRIMEVFKWINFNR